MIFFLIKCVVFFLVIVFVLLLVVLVESLYDVWFDFKVFVSFCLCYEGVSQDNVVKDVSVLMLCILLSYEFGSYKGFFFKVDLEDVIIVMGQGDYIVGLVGYNLGQYLVIVDLEIIEFN